MKTNFTLPVALFFLFGLIYCSKNPAEEDEPVDVPPPTAVIKNCLLSAVDYIYGHEMPYYANDFTLQYDTKNRVSLKKESSFLTSFGYEANKTVARSYVNSISLINMTGRIVYNLNPDSVITDHAEYFYNRPSSEEDYIRQDITSYEYNPEGYLKGTKTYAYGVMLMNESKFYYQSGNLVKNETIYYDLGSIHPKVIGTDINVYKYDTVSFFTVSTTLPEIMNTGTGKKNKNNVTEIQVEKADFGTSADSYKNIRYNYIMEEKELKEVKISAKTRKGKDITGSVKFDYKCD